MEEPEAAGQAGACPEPDTAALKAVVEAIVYVTEQPVTAAQIASAVAQPEERVRAVLAELMADYGAPAHGILVREVAGGYQMATKPEHHEAIRAFAKSLKPPLKLSLAALETLATIAYKQPVTAPEIMAIRGVQGAGVLKTLLDRKLIAIAGRKNVIGRPMLYRTTTDFLVQFGLKDLSELPTLKEFEELRRLAGGDEEELGAGAAGQPAAEGSAGEGAAAAAEDSVENVAAAEQPVGEGSAALGEAAAAGENAAATSEDAAAGGGTGFAEQSAPDEDAGAAEDVPAEGGAGPEDPTDG